MLGLSMLLHAWLIENHYGKGAARSSAGGASIAARILPAVSETDISSPVITMPGIVEPTARALIAADSAAVPARSMQATGAALVLAAAATTAMLS